MRNRQNKQKKKTNYQITIGYKAVVTIDVVAEDEESAKDHAFEIFKISKDKAYQHKGVVLQDDNFKIDGIINMDETWNML